ncbi:alpha/beta fold hydrolase [Streptomyces sp. NPDC059816]|uniref:alpha/beta fold hydrolase n=1 Tax=Streptomyces sp. NPDC059816 TaxID=3346960 RepID=UPI00364A540B
MPRRSVLSDGGGSTWGVAEYGDPAGHPLVLHHGLIGSAVLPHVWDQLAGPAGVRLIAVERPGYGVTPPREMTRIAEWATLLEPLLDRLGVDAFDVLGISAGAPYAYALAAGFGERVRGVWVLSGLPYVCDDAVRGHYPQAAEPVWAFYREGPPDEVAASFAAAAPRFAGAFATSPTMLAALAEVDDHHQRGPAREVRLQSRPWGFTLADVRRPVRLWHAVEDEQVPFEAVRATAALLPDARLTEQPEPTHVPAESSLRALFGELAERRVAPPEEGGATQRH